ncbi:MAG: Hsp20/alpha crystallin family protein [Acidimicrobiia bacterium]|nr:Hsp20/alpha crystallin family protein [Acidimicrobiia bacterium]
MLLRYDPFRELDRMAEQVLGTTTAPRTRSMPMDAYRRGDKVFLHFDLPGVQPDSIELTVERDVLTVSAERAWPEMEGDQLFARERAQGTFSRRVLLGETLDTDKVDARYEDGVLTVAIPVAEQAKPRKVEVHVGEAKTIEA